MRITKMFDWHCSHHLVDYKGLCKNLHGHSYKMEIEVEGRTKTKGSENGMVVDFGTLKTIVKTAIVDKFDHALVLWDKDTEVIRFAERQNWKTLILPFNTTAENMVRWIYKELTEKKRLIGHWKVIRVRLYETDTSYAEYNRGDKFEN